MSVVDEVELAELRSTREHVARLHDRRDELIRKLVADGIPRHRIAEAAGITRQHTYNIAPGGNPS